jgi:FKBP-type peptidyl-prolyl cis-trans isomerase FklB
LIFAEQTSIFQKDFYFFMLDISALFSSLYKMFLRHIVLVVLVASLAFLAVYGAQDSKKKGDMDAYRKRTGAKYLAEKAKEAGVIKLQSGMLVEILKSNDEADAKSPKEGDSCEVSYSGTLKDGTKFDAGTTSFAPNQVIKGWTQAMQLMAEGDKWKLHIPYDLAYGERGSPPKIPPYSPLVFDIEIHKVKSGGKPAAEARAAFEKAKATSDEL